MLRQLRRPASRQERNDGFPGIEAQRPAELFAAPRGTHFTDKGVPDKRYRHARVGVELLLEGKDAQGPNKPPPDQIHSPGDRKSTRLNSSHGYISYAVFCLKKKKKTQTLTAFTLCATA